MPAITRKAAKGDGDARGGGSKTVDPGNINKKSIGGASAAAGGADTGAHEDDDALAAFFQEINKQDETAVTKDIRKASIIAGQKFFRLGPEFIDEDFLECTPIPLYGQMIPILNYDSYLDKSPDELVQVTPIRPQTFSALFAFYRDRGPALNWDPSLTDLEEDCFFQEVINFPTSKLAYIIPREKKKDKVKKRRVKIFKPNGDYAVKTRLYIDLVETPTIFLVEIIGSWVPENDATIAEIKEKNEKYVEMVHRHSHHGSFAHDYSQTFESYRLSVYTDYKIQGCADVWSECHMHNIEDDLRRAAADEIKRKIRENDEMQAKLLADKALQDEPEPGKNSDDSSGDEEDTTARVDLSIYKDDENRDEEMQFLVDEGSADEIPMSSDADDEFEINSTLQTIYDRKRHNKKHLGLRIYPDISFSIIALERIICMDSQQENQADMRGFTAPEEIKAVVGTVEEAVGEVVDEDAMVDLLIQQHRMQEQLEKPEGDQGTREPGEITEADLLRMQAEIEADAEGDEEEMTGGGKHEATKVEESAAAPTVDDDEKDAFDLALEDGAIMDFGDDGVAVLMDQQLLKGGDRQVDGDRDTDQRDDDTFSERYGMDDYDGGSRPTGDKEGKVILGNLRCEWSDTAERDADFREDITEAKASEEIIFEEKLDLIPASLDDDVEYVPPPMPPDPTAITVEKKEMFEELGVTFPDLIKKTKVATPEEIREQEFAMFEQEDDISDQSDRDEDSQLSDHKGLEENIEDSSDVLSNEDSVALYKEFAPRRSSVSRHFGLKAATSEMLANLMGETDGPYLKQFWKFTAKITAGKEVTDIALHPSNGNLIAVSYGTFQFGKETTEGIVCIWNAKNNRSPERLYYLKSPPTALAFSEFSPYILAVGTLDGNIVIYDVRESDAVIMWSTFAQEDKHMGPVWVIYWLVEEDSANELSVAESMLSLGDDGYLKRWSMAKGLESIDVMKVMRSTMLIPGRREKRNESLITTLSTAYTVCFFPDNTELFLLGTEEGFIHKCSTAYKDQYVSTYVGHTGPVYRICFSAFDETVFVSCGGDWSIRIWKTDHLAPLLSMNTGLRTIFDVACSLYSSTIFICCAEFHIEVWDLSINTLEPAVQHHFHNDTLGLRKVAFNGSLNSVIIGDDDGGVHIFGLRKFPKPQIGRGAQVDVLMEALLPGYKKRQKESSQTQLNSAGSQNLKSIKNNPSVSASFGKL